MGPGHGCGSNGPSRTPRSERAPAATNGSGASARVARERPRATGRLRIYAAATMTERRDFDLASVLAELRRRAWLIFLCTFLSAGLAFGLSQLLDERYEATADLLFVET